jgi:hypothetical protein
MLGPEGLPEEALGGCGIARLTEQKIDGLASGIDLPAEIIPLLLDLDVCLIDPLGVVRPFLSYGLAHHWHGFGLPD